MTVRTVLAGGGNFLDLSKRSPMVEAGLDGKQVVPWLTEGVRLPI